MAFRQPEDGAQEGATPVTMHHANVAEIIPSLPLETRWPPFQFRHYAGHSFLLQDETHRRVPCKLPQVWQHLAQGPRLRNAEAFHASAMRRQPSVAPLQPHDIVRFLELEFDTRDEFEALSSPRVLFTHLPYSLLPSSIVGECSGCRIVYICREPKDALVSFWFFSRKVASAWGVDAQSFTIQDAFELFCQGRCQSGPLWKHVLQYWEESLRRPDKVLFLRYKDMLLEPERNVKKLAKFMGCEFSKEEDEGGVVSAIVELCNLRKLKDMEVNRNGSTRLGAKNESYLRKKGVAGDWSNHMTPEMAQRLDKVVEDALQETGFTFARLAWATLVSYTVVVIKCKISRSSGFNSIAGCRNHATIW